MTEDGKPCASDQSAPGTLPTELSGGAEPIPSVLQVLMQQAKTMEAMAYTIDQMAIHNQELTDMLLDRDDQDEEDQGHGLDMAGKPIRTS